MPDGDGAQGRPADPRLRGRGGAADGRRVPFIPFPTPLRNAAGELVGAVNMLVDISERKESETRQKTLVDELNHRVKNTLATVQSLAAQTAAGGQVPKHVRDAFEGRLVALSRAHDQLTREHWERPTSPQSSTGSSIPTATATAASGPRVSRSGSARRR